MEHLLLQHFNKQIAHVIILHNIMDSKYQYIISTEGSLNNIRNNSDKSVYNNNNTNNRHQYNNNQ